MKKFILISKSNRKAWGDKLSTLGLRVLTISDLEFSIVLQKAIAHPNLH